MPIRAGYGVQANETVFNGNRTLNSIRQAESQVFGAREQLRNTEQNTLLSAVTAYMDVLEDTAILDLDNNNVDVLREQLRETRDRFTVGEVTRTDVAQAEASLAQGQGTALSAVATLQAAVARYRQFIGDQPKSLAPVKPIMAPLPKTLPEAISISQVEHPAISGSLHGVDAAQLQVKIAEGALYPSIGLSASVSNQFDVSGEPGIHVLSGELLGQITIPIYQGGAEYAYGVDAAQLQVKIAEGALYPTIGISASLSNQYDVNGEPGIHVLAGQILGQISIPIYQGGAEYATTRQAKESLSQQEIQTDSLRNQVRQAVVAAWGLNQAAVGVVRAARASVSANEVALTGVREEAKVGQRTTLDVLNAQQALLQARTTLVQAEHDQVVDSYSLLSAIGRLNIPTLGLSVAEYDPRVHFDQVKNKWIGLRTPSGQ